VAISFVATWTVVLSTQIYLFVAGYHSPVRTEIRRRRAGIRGFKARYGFSPQELLNKRSQFS
jgi:hypothetical protein